VRIVPGAPEGGHRAKIARLSRKRFGELGTVRDGYMEKVEPWTRLEA